MYCQLSEKYWEMHKTIGQKFGSAFFGIASVTMRLYGSTGFGLTTKYKQAA
jgi:hypothetical protein